MGNVLITVGAGNINTTGVEICKFGINGNLLDTIYYGDILQKN